MHQCSEGGAMLLSLCLGFIFLGTNTCMTVTALPPLAWTVSLAPVACQAVTMHIALANQSIYLSLSLHQSVHGQTMLV